MADFQSCFAFMMANEDSANLHAQVSDACPPGVAGPCWAISGINSGVYPTQFSVLAAAPQSARGPLVEVFYKTYIWDRWFGAATSTDLMMRVFDCTVNLGERKAVRLLQQSVPDSSLVPDGLWGPVTLAAVNAADPVATLTAFKAARREHYLLNDANNPALSALLIRAAK